GILGVAILHHQVKVGNRLLGVALAVDEQHRIAPLSRDASIAIPYDAKHHRFNARFQYVVDAGAS
ncbi:MAG TPA: hypothetical protein VLT92_11215, partial [Burkholderiales bacterium]|nr:hypothetical protein [Burkholderiales bacterium]